ncbi:MAG TPA: dienelactone hydrolase family protein [Burkholderiaceae bacterium]|nr:dienelactone hydrolase family protein [Burkholderiaceae bacterium]
MQERSIDIKTRDGNMNTYVFHPDGPGPYPVVIHYMDSVGLREELSDMCRRLASVGYYVLLPNLYYRLARSVDLDADRLNDPAYAEKRDLMWTLNRHLTNTMIEQDTAAMFDFLTTDPAARPGKLGIVGYCMSGRFVYRVAGAFPERVAASASIYGARLLTDLPDSAHLLTDRIKGEMYFACAQHDHYITNEALEQIGALMKAANVRGSIEFYPEAEHGFAFPQRRAFHKASAERHWERLFALFRRNL